MANTGRYSLMQPSHAVSETGKLLVSLGYLAVGKPAGGSRYYARVGFPHRKIRVSDHPHTKLRDDCVHSISYEGPTIWPDVKFRVERADREFRAATGREAAMRTRESSARPDCLPA